MLTAHAFLPTARIESLGPAPALAADLESEVERLWQAEQRSRGKPLFNGHILSATEVGPARIAGRRVEYRCLVAQRARPELFEALGVRPVAVSGILRCPDGVVFGRRARSSAQDPGLWELVPSGGVDMAGIAEAGLIDIRNQMLTELNEEVGLSAGQVTVSAPFCLIEDHESKVLDIGLALTAPALTADIHYASSEREYDELAVIPQAGLKHFLEQVGTQLVSVSRMLLSLSRDTQEI